MSIQEALTSKSLFKRKHWKSWVYPPTDNQRISLCIYLSYDQVQLTIEDMLANDWVINTSIKLFYSNT